MYGVVNANGEHTDVSHTERGAKNFATRNHYSKVSIRYNCSFDVDIISVKKGRKWVKPTSN